MFSVLEEAAEKTSRSMKASIPALAGLKPAPIRQGFPAQLKS